MASWPFFAVVAVVLSIAVLVEPETLARRAVTVGAVGVLITVLHAISRAGRPLLASWLLIVGLTLIVTQRAWGTGGINAPVSVFYALFIVMAGMLIGLRGSLTAAALSLAGGVVLTVATLQGWLTPRAGAGSALGGLVFVLLAIALALLIQVLMAVQTRRVHLGPDAAQMLAHDMRAPMHAVFAHLEMLREETHGRTAAEVEAAIEGVSVLNRMTDNFIDAGRLEAGELPVNRSMTDLAAVARSVVADLGVIQRTRKMAVEARGDASCACDRDLIRRVVENLVSNAMKHTDVGAGVLVVIEGGSDAVLITVRDEGAGVPENQRQRIFEPYVSTSKAPNTVDVHTSGIGLAFCRLAAEAHGGTIRVEDSPPRGSAFVVELPR